MSVTIPASYVVTTTDEKIACGGCGVPTGVRVNGHPWHVGNYQGQCQTWPVPDDTSPRLLDALIKHHAPQRKGRDGKLHGPYWRPPMPGILDIVHVTASWSWERHNYYGAGVVLDRNASWIGAASSVDVAHGELEATGPGEYAKRPGYYQVQVYPWNERHLPHPLGITTMPTDRTMWIPGPRRTLLHQLAEAGRWPDATHLDSYTGDPCRLDKWATYVNTNRTNILKTHGKDSDQYESLKVGYSQAVTIMRGTPNPGGARKYITGCQRADWCDSIQDQGAVNQWRTADKINAFVRKHNASGDTIVAMRNVDELVVTPYAYRLLREQDEPPITLDEDGHRLGTFKTKGHEQWT